MLTREVIETIVNSTWCTLPEVWDWTLRSNSILRLLDLDYPGTYGIHASYSLLDKSLLFVLITVPADVDLDDLLYKSDKFDSSISTRANYRELTIYRKELAYA